MVYRPASEGLRCDDDSTFDLGNCGFDDYTGTGDAFYCDRSEMVCRTRAALGAPCINSDECLKGTQCLNKSARR